MEIITKTGDKGSTSLWMGGRVPKYDIRIETIGKIDTFNGSLGLIHPHLGAMFDDIALSDFIFLIQKKLAFLMGELACTEDEKQNYILNFEYISDEHVSYLDDYAKTLLTCLEDSGYVMDHWRLYGESCSATAQMDFSSKLCREAEVQLHILKSQGYKVRDELLIFMNRLSDVLFIMAMYKEVFSNKKYQNNFNSKLV